MMDESLWHPSARGYNFVEPICKHGHDKRIVGVSGRQCYACKLISNKASRERRRPYWYAERFCCRGHDKSVVGVKKRGDCLACAKQDYKRSRVKRARTNPQSLMRAQRMPHLRQVRKELGVSMRWLSRETGIPLGTLKGIEYGARAKPAKMAKILDVVAREIYRKRREERYG